MPGWTLAQGTSFTAVQYGATGGFPTALDKGPKNRRTNFFAGGPDDVSPIEIATQTVDVSKYAGTIDLGVVDSYLVGWLGGSSSQADNAMLEVDWYSATGWTRPYPGDSRILTPSEVPGRLALADELGDG